jgi:hypothetical protein
MTEVKTVACECPNNCVCVVSVEEAIVVDGKYYCSSACAEGHKDGSKGCGCANNCPCG